uniref:Putative capsid protein n=1 Tax=Emberiza spodocephala densovirus TaxID=2794496 RepID=A0A8E7G275_9VIRU|nr:MAG: putative capsid protein [Emberiza spodocephala densovirus]
MYKMQVDGEAVSGVKRPWSGEEKGVIKKGSSHTMRAGEKGVGEQIGIASLYKEIASREQVKRLKIYRTEFASIDTNLWYFPLQHSVSAFFSKQIAEYAGAAIKKNNYKYVEVVLHKMVIKNPIVLSDTITVTGAGATEVSSFVQNGKILHYKLGKGSGNAHAYSMLIGEDKLGMLAENMQTGKDETKGGTWLAQMVTQTANSVDTINEIKVLPLQFDQGIVNGVDEIISKEKVPFNFGYVRPLSQTTLNPALLTVTENELPQLYLRDYAHTYINPGDEVEINLPKDLRIMAENFPKVLKKESMKRGETGNSQLYYAPFGYYSEVMTAGDGHAALTMHRASKRHLWQEHDYLTLLPIRNSSGAFMKIRATIEINFEASINLIWADSSFTEQASESENVEENTRLGFCYKELYHANNKDLNLVMKH